MSVAKYEGRIVRIWDVSESGLVFSCVECGGDMIARRGNVRVHHFAHKRDDSRACSYHPMSKWHSEWQRCFERIEVGMRDDAATKKRADAVSADGSTVIEFQHSYISNDEIKDREAFYGDKLVWVVDATEVDAYDVIGSLGLAGKDEDGRMYVFPEKVMKPWMLGMHARTFIHTRIGMLERVFGSLFILHAYSEDWCRKTLGSATEASHSTIHTDARGTLELYLSKRRVARRGRSVQWLAGPNGPADEFNTNPFTGKRWAGERDEWWVRRHTVFHSRVACHARYTALVGFPFEHRHALPRSINAKWNDRSKCWVIETCNLGWLSKYFMLKPHREPVMDVWLSFFPDAPFVACDECDERMPDFELHWHQCEAERSSDA